MLQQTLATAKTSKPKRVFISYSHEDEELKKLLLIALRQFEVEGHITSWHDRKIIPGQRWAEEIDINLHAADLVLFLVSESFLESKYCSTVEVKIAMELEKEKKTYIVPIILRKCDWRGENFASLAALPKDGQPLSSKEGVLAVERLEEVVEGLRLALLDLWLRSGDGEMPGATVGSYSLADTEVNSVPSTIFAHFRRAESCYDLPNLRGLKIPNDPPFNLNFSIDVGSDYFQGEKLKSEADKIKEFFCYGFSVSAENMWVNLSPYESNQMLPEILAGTRLGRALLEFDLKLKILASSLLHPDCNTGKIYWQEIYNRARKQFGTSVVSRK